VVRAKAPAAGRQVRVFLSSERCRKRAKAEEQNQQDGKCARHLALMVQEWRGL
jgi:hypothetical protein